MAFRRAAKWGDGVIYGSTPRRMEKMLARVGELVEANGRDPAHFGAEAMVDFTAGPKAWVEEVEHWEKLGGTHLALRAMDTAAEFTGEKVHGYAGPQSYIDALETFMKEVGSLNTSN